MRILKKQLKKGSKHRNKGQEQQLKNNEVNILGEKTNSNEDFDLLSLHFDTEEIDMLFYDSAHNKFRLPVFCKNLKLLKKIPVSMNNFMESLHGENIDIISNLLEKTNITKPVRLNCRYIIYRDNIKEYIPVEVTIIPGLNIPNTFVFVIKNIYSEEKQRKELLKSKEKIEESDKLKSIILSNISHHIRTPLNSVTGFSELLAANDYKDPKRKDYIDIIKKQSKRILTLIDDISEIAKLESGNINISNTPCSLNLVLGELLSGINKYRANKRKEQVIISSNLPSKGIDIMTDSGRLIQALTHILNYSLRYTNHGKIELGYAYIKDIDKVEFYIQDTSNGLTKEEQKLIFSKFTAIDNSESQRLDDPGLGLTIAKAIIKAMGGKIWVESDEGKGCKFIFQLPFEAVPKSPDDILELTEDETQRVLYEWPNKVILVVDDEEVNAMFLDAVFHGTSVQLLFAKNGREAIELCQSINKIDLILMDLKMPVLNGIRATMEIRKFNPHIPIIAQTALSSEEDRYNCEEVGCNDIITKPIEVAQLLELVNIYLAD